MIITIVHQTRSAATLYIDHAGTGARNQCPHQVSRHWIALHCHSIISPCGHDCAHRLLSFHEIETELIDNLLTGWADIKQISNEIHSIHANPEKSEQEQSGKLISLAPKIPRWCRLLFFWWMKLDATSRDYYDDLALSVCLEREVDGVLPICRCIHWESELLEDARPSLPL
jgi:hypothetical protein